MDNTHSIMDNAHSIIQPSAEFVLGSSQDSSVHPSRLEEGRVIHKAPSCTSIVTLDRDNSRLFTESNSMESNSSAPELDPHRDTSHVQLPQKKGPRIYRLLRWNSFSVYRRIFGLAFAGNAIAAIILLVHKYTGGPDLNYQEASVAVTANILTGVAARNEHVVNALFLVFGTWPKKAPLRLRRIFAKVYSYGGVHSSCGVAATLWYIVFLYLLTSDYTGASLSVLRGYVLLVGYAIVTLLISILIFAHPRLRVAMHNWFEGVHRFMGWAVVLLFWALVMLLCADDTALGSASFGEALITNPTFWMLLAATLLIAYPWTRLRVRNVESEVLSGHCVKLNFDYANVQYGQAVRLTDNPLRETHAFAVIPNAPSAAATADTAGAVVIEKQPAKAWKHGHGPETSVRTLSSNECSASIAGFCNAGEQGFSVLVSNAGDWTQKIIRNPPTKLYTRGAPQTGVLRIAGLFKPCIVIATGSGIGPCLSLFVQKPEHPVRIIWSAKSPAETYGSVVIDLLYRNDPRAIIIDTSKDGRPDLVQIAHRLWESSKKEATGACEAAVIISNQKVTQKVVYGLESRGIPAYGAIFDS